jgi:hypothetical protein
MWPPKPPDSVEFFTIDLVRQLALGDGPERPGDRITSCACAIETIRGEDPEAADMLLGDAEINGTQVSQKVVGGTVGCRYRLTFTAETLFGETLTPSGDFLVGTSKPGARDLATLQAVKDWLPNVPDKADALLQRLISSESAAIERHLCRPVLPEERTDVIIGYGSSTVMPPATPILAIERVLVDGAQVAVRHDGLTIWRADGLHWPRGARVQVTYTAGYDTVPPDVEGACIELVAFRYRERDRIGHQSMSIAAGTVSYITSAMPHSVEARLAPYKKVAPN